MIGKLIEKMIQKKLDKVMAELEAELPDRLVEATDYDKVLELTVARLEPSDIAESIDTDDLELDYEEIAGSVDLRQLAGHIDEEDVAGYIDHGDVADRVWYDYGDDIKGNCASDIDASDVAEHVDTSDIISELVSDEDFMVELAEAMVNHDHFDYDSLAKQIIPDEIVQGLRTSFDVEMQQFRRLAKSLRGMVEAMELALTECRMGFEEVSEDA